LKNFNPMKKYFLPLLFCFVSLACNADKDMAMLSDAPNKQMQQATPPDSVLALLQRGNARFVSKESFEYDYFKQIHQTEQEQSPYAVILECMDSRVAAEVVFNVGLGEIFNLRVAGNVVSEDILFSLEYAVEHVGAKLIVVMGHTHCGAIKAAYESYIETLQNPHHLLLQIYPAIQTGRSLDEIAQENVFLQIKNILAQSIILTEAIAENKVKIVAALYDVETGKVNFMNTK